MPTAPLTAADWRALPKVLLHEHLDGGLRPATLLELCRKRNVATPADTAGGLADWLLANSDSGSLVRYLTGFSLTVAAMASLEACERVAFEAAEDARIDGCVLAEFRIAPLLLEHYGLHGDDVVEALLAGLRRSKLPCGLIVCAMRMDPPAETLRAAQLASRFNGQGVIGFDLAGAELGFPPTPHGAAIKAARDAGLGITLHAGEADAGSRVLEAAGLGATRIGHGVNIMKAPNADEQQHWLEKARHQCLHFEVCPTSNVHTGTAPSMASHPLHAMADAGLSVSVSTDNRLMSGITLSRELQRAHQENGVSIPALGGMMREAARVSFLPEESRAAALEALSAWPR
jgi:adenosine deaminase